MMIFIENCAKFSRKCFYHIDRYLGHGRALETYLIGLKFLMAMDITSAFSDPKIRLDHVVALWDLEWWVPVPLIATPFFATGLIQMVGMILNYKGIQSSWILRAIGASLGVLIWSWLILKSLAIHQLNTGLFPVAIMSFLASIWILWKAYNRRPAPGAVGLV